MSCCEHYTPCLCDVCLKSRDEEIARVREQERKRATDIIQKHSREIFVNLESIKHIIEFDREIGPGEIAL